MGIVKVAFIGGGFMIKEHIKAFASLNNVECVGICNRTLEKANNIADEFNIKYRTSSIDELYNNTKPDLVVIAVYETIAKEIINKAIQFPWIILAEKPIGLNLEETININNNVKANNAKLFVATNRRCLSSTQLMINDLNNREGKRILRIVDNQDINFAKTLGHHDLVCKNWMYANSIHLIDYFIYFCRGEITKVTNITNYKANGAPCNVISHIIFSSGDTGIYFGLWNDMPGPWSVEINHSDIRWRAEPLEIASFAKKGERTLQTLLKEQVDIDYKPGLVLQAQEMINFIQTSKKPIIPDSQETVKLCTLIQSIFHV